MTQGRITSNQFEPFGAQRRVDAVGIARQTRARRIRPGQWLGHCPGPVHRNGDRHPSLSIREGRNGAVLLFCFCGCQTEDVLRALRLTFANISGSQPFFPFTDPYVHRWPVVPQVFSPEQQRRALLKGQWRETATRFRWLHRRIDAGELAWIPLTCDCERALDEIHCELCQIEKRGRQ